MIEDPSRAAGSAEPPAFRHDRRLAVPAALLLIALACLLAWALWRLSAPDVPAPAPPRIVAAQRGGIDRTVEAEGKLQLFRYADVIPDISGRIAEVYVNLGDEIKAGKLVLKIKPAASASQLDSNQAQLARLKAELAEQRAQLDFAQLQFKRQTQLKAENATREEAFEASRTAMYAAAARVDAINARIRQTELAIREDVEKRRRAEEYAPFAGTVVMLSARPGQAVEAGQQTPLMRIADLSKLTVQARVAEIDVPHLYKGMPAHFTTPGYPGQQWSGKIRQIVPVPADGSGEQGRETFYNVLFEVANPDRRLMSGMSAQVSFVLAHADNAVLIPSEALGRPDGEGLYTVTVIGKDGQPAVRRLRIGLRNRRQAQVLAGLEPGERVVIAASSSARPQASAGAMPH